MIPCYLCVTGGFLLSEERCLVRRSFLEQRVQRSTRLRYEQNGYLWFEFLDTLGIEDPYLQTFALDLKRVVLVEFVMYLEALVAPAEVSRVLTALRHQFRSACHSVEVFEDEVVRTAKECVRKVSGREQNILREQQRRLPVTLDFVVRSREHFWATIDLDRRMLYLGIALAFNFMLRASEYILDSKSDQHTLLGSDVLLFTDDNRVKLSPSELRSQPWTNITSVMFVIRSSKKDQDGHGRYLFLNKRSPLESQLVEDVVWWSIHSGSQESEPFLSRVSRGRGKKLTRRLLTEAVREVARLLHFEGEMVFSFKLHSLRIGGATCRMSAGGDRSMTQRVGGWSTNSACDQLYYLNTPLDQGALAMSRTDTHLLSSLEVHQMVPSSVLHRTR